ncbi:hypothetical protein RFI_02335 [Reticulomyxa filosa]|uniref:Uncharacterized protein n=1 Tax=Reticulomyxa filosa TaxID=46433 RepID=X6P9G4_RETFI|nr:hypothetical protein RFI_02335 [Reticulomyxa filosa]|eukprot:ETO34758.1 hypothetical protein RFI_02335 [Reticulomyxa filosa]
MNTFHWHEAKYIISRIYPILLSLVHKLPTICEYIIESIVRLCREEKQPIDFILNFLNVVTNISPSRNILDVVYLLQNIRQSFCFVYYIFFFCLESITEFKNEICDVVDFRSNTIRELIENGHNTNDIKPAIEYWAQFAYNPYVEKEKDIAPVIKHSEYWLLTQPIIEKNTTNKTNAKIGPKKRGLLEMVTSDVLITIEPGINEYDATPAKKKIRKVQVTSTQDDGFDFEDDLETGYSPKHRSMTSDATIIPTFSEALLGEEDGSDYGADDENEMENENKRSGKRYKRLKFEKEKKTKAKIKINKRKTMSDENESEHRIENGIENGIEKMKMELKMESKMESKMEVKPKDKKRKNTIELDTDIRADLLMYVNLNASNVKEHFRKLLLRTKNLLSLDPNEPQTFNYIIKLLQRMKEFGVLEDNDIIQAFETLDHFINKVNPLHYFGYRALVTLVQIFFDEICNSLQTEGTEIIDKWLNCLDMLIRMKDIVDSFIFDMLDWFTKRDVVSSFSLRYHDLKLRACIERVEYGYEGYNEQNWVILKQEILELYEYCNASIQFLDISFIRKILTYLNEKLHYWKQWIGDNEYQNTFARECYLLLFDNGNVDETSLIAVLKKIVSSQQKKINKRKFKSSLYPPYYGQIALNTPFLTSPYYLKHSIFCDFYSILSKDNDLTFPYLSLKLKQERLYNDNWEMNPINSTYNRKSTIARTYDVFSPFNCINIDQLQELSNTASLKMMQQYIRVVQQLYLRKDLQHVSKLTSQSWKDIQRIRKKTNKFFSHLELVESRFDFLNQWLIKKFVQGTVCPHHPRQLENFRK